MGRNGPIRRTIKQTGEYRLKLRDLSGLDTVVKEILQNADDAGAQEVSFEISPSALIVSNSASFSSCPAPEAEVCAGVAGGKHGRICDLHSFREVSGGTNLHKQDREYTGAYGVGFISVYQVTDTPELISSGVHWKIEDDTETIEPCSGCTRDHSAQGTVFVLPWASEQSRLRSELDQPTVPMGGPNGGYQTILDTARYSLLFLRNVRSITISSPDRNEVLLRDDSSKVGDARRCHWDTKIESVAGDERWLVLSGTNSSARIDRLRESREGSQSLAGRNTIVQVGISLDDQSPVGRIYGTLPTEIPLVPGLSINGGFVLKMDRKRLGDDHVHTTFNTHLLHTAAAVLAENIELVAEWVPQERLLEMLVQLRRRATGSDSPVAAFYERAWQMLAPALADRRVIRDHVGDLVAPSGCIDDSGLLADRAELRDLLGMRLLHPSTIGLTGELRDVLKFRALTVALVAERCRSRPVAEAWPADTRTVPAWMPQMHGILGDLPAASAAKTIRCVPTTRGGWEAASGCYEASGYPDILEELLVELPIVDSALISPDAAAVLAQHFTHWTSEAVIEVLEGRPEWASCHWQGLLHWLSSMRVLSANLRDRIVELPVYPTSDGPVPLTDAYFPDFEDPLGMKEIRLIDAAAAGPYRQFLVSRLGARSLDLPTYMEEFGIRALSRELTDRQREIFLALVCQEIRQIKGDDGIVAALRAAPLLPFRDGAKTHWLRSDDVRMPSTDIAGIDGVKRLGSRCPTPGVQDARWNELLLLLEVPSVVSTSELADGIRQTTEAADPTRSAALLKNLLGHPRAKDPHLRQLLGGPWLPTKGGTVDRATAVYLESEAEILDDPRMIVAAPAGADRFLTHVGVNEEAPLVAVVAKAESIAAGHGDMPDRIYERLAGAPAVSLGRFSDRSIVQFEPGGPYFASDELFFEGHGIDGYAVIVPTHFSARHRELLERLGARLRPDHEVALEVLLDAHRTQQAGKKPISKIVRQAWELLHQAEGIGAEVLSDLACLPTGGDHLRRPSECYFADARRFSERFDSLEGRVVKRSHLDATYRAAGVGDLEPFIGSQVNPSGAGVDTGLVEWLRDFFPHMARVVLHGRRTGFEKDIADLKVRLQALEVRKADVLEETASLRLPGEPEGSSITHKVHAHLDTDGAVPVLYVHGGFRAAITRSAGASAVARELGAHVFGEMGEARHERSVAVLESLVRSADPADGEDVLADKGIDPAPELLENPWDLSYDVPALQDHESLGGSEAGAAGATHPVREEGGKPEPSTASTGPVRAPNGGDGSAGPQTGTAPGRSRSTGGPKPTPATGEAESSSPSPASVASGRGPVGAESSDESEEPPLGESVGGSSEGGDSETQPPRRVELQGRALEDPEVRQQRARDAAAKNPLKAKGRRTGSVDVTRPRWDREESRDYLGGEYVDPVTRIPVCQICRYPSPFQTRDGDWYLEAVLFFPDLRHEDVYNRLALCPACSAKLRFGDSTSRKQMAKWARSQRLTRGQTTVVKPIRLAGRPAEVTFTADHLARIKGGLDHHDGR